VPVGIVELDDPRLVGGALESGIAKGVAIEAVADAFTGSLLLGLVAEHASIRAAWILAGMILSASVVLLILIERKRMRSPAERLASLDRLPADHSSAIT
jgi:hypothetical protein